MRKTAKRKSLRKNEGMLFGVAESIGSTLGRIAAKTGVVQKTLRIGKTSRKRRPKKT